MAKKSRRSTRRVRRRQRGGQAPLGDASIAGPSSASAAQGLDYAKIHANQHGGKILYGGAAPLDSIGQTLPPQMQGAAAVSPTMTAFNEIRGMSDQSGGARRRGKGSRKSRKGRRSMRGGAMPSLAPAGVSEPGMLVPPSSSTPGMNPEWKLAEDPTSFAPQAGGAHKRGHKGGKAGRKGRKGSKKASRKGSKKASRKGRKASRKGRKGSKKFFGLF